MVYDKGKFGVGVSLCNFREDKFDRTEGVRLATERAYESHKNNGLLLKDVVNLQNAESFKVCGCKLPKGSYDKIVSVADAYVNLVDDMIYTIALNKVRAETE